MHSIKQIIENRQVRIFMSSTFADMQDERSALIKTFELLKVEAAKRNISLNIVDLRWGITEEEVKLGKVISVCLNEIEYSHPFFIGILGNNYGTLLDALEIKKNPDLIERYPWIEKDISIGMSITELEIRYGALGKKKKIDALFFFRDDNTTNDNNSRLDILKKDIRKYYTPYCYSSIAELCDKVTLSVRIILDKYFPVSSTISLLDKERSAQRAYINHIHANHIERKSYFDKIDSFINSNKQYFVLIGESGIGKSAILANWIKKNEREPNFNIFYHFVSNSFSENNVESILRHLCDEICNLYFVKNPLDEKENIEMEAKRLIADLYSYDKPLIIIIDGINQISSTKDKNEKSLLWLPSANKNVKFIFSTVTEDDTYKVFKRRKYEIVMVKPLKTYEKKRLINTYLKHVGKKLDEKKKQLQRILNWNLSSNTLVLRTLLDELICFGVYEKVDERISYYTEATSIPIFFDCVLQRMEQDYSKDQELVQNALKVIALSENGLSEDELISILDCKDHVLDWKLFFCAFHNHFIIKNGYISFSHQYINQTVTHRYLEDSKKQEETRERIVNSFSQFNTVRGSEEVSYQLYMLASWDRLFNQISQISIFLELYNIHKNNLEKYWLALKNKKYNPNIYLKQINALPYKRKLNALHILASFSCRNIIDIRLADYCTEELLKLCKSNNLDRSEVLITRGECQLLSGDYKSAIDSFQNALRIVKHHDEDDLNVRYSLLTAHQEIILNGEQLYLLNRILVEADMLCIASALKYGENTYKHATFLTQKGLFLRQIKNYRLAIKDLLEAHTIYIELMGSESIDCAISLSNLGLIYADMLDFQKSIDCLNQALTLIRKIIGDLPNMQIAAVFGNLSYAYSKRGNHKSSFRYQEKALKNYLRLYGSSPNPYVAECYYNMSYEAEQINEFRTAYEYGSKDYEMLCSLHGDNSHIARASRERLLTLLNKL